MPSYPNSDADTALTAHLEEWLLIVIWHVPEKAALLFPLGFDALVRQICKLFFSIRIEFMLHVTMTLETCWTLELNGVSAWQAYVLERCALKVKWTGLTLLGCQLSDGVKCCIQGDVQMCDTFVSG